MALELWTDGSCENGVGGYAVIVKDDDFVSWFYEGGFGDYRGYAVTEADGSEYKVARMGRATQTSNIRMEGEAILAAMEYCGFAGGVIHTDSEFWVKVLTEWGRMWELNNFRRSGGALKNLDLVKKVYLAYRKYPVEVVWTKGHSGDAMNKLADEWARVARVGM